jgi:hypothetical protein
LRVRHANFRPTKAGRREDFVARIDFLWPDPSRHTSCEDFPNRTKIMRLMSKNNYDPRRGRGPNAMKGDTKMTRRMIAMNVQTREISFTDLTAQEIAELQAITDDYRSRFDPPHRPKKPMQRDQGIESENTADCMAQAAR